MGVGGHFWDLLKPYARHEGFDFLRDKKVAIDLSYWIVQQETAIKSHFRSAHIRLTFFRTINLFAKFGAYPVFVVDGKPSPLKSRARILRFFRSSGIDPLSNGDAEKGVGVERNALFTKFVRECTELLELLGMPVLKAEGEAEALCATLNREGYVDACITADSDAFLYGAECVIKAVKPNTQEPFECYRLSDIEVGLGVKRKHLIAISLLVGNDYDLNGVQGIGVDTALRFVKSFDEDEILDRLHEIGRGDTLKFSSSVCHDGDFTTCSSDSSKTTSPHCSQCGHLGSKRMHITFGCEDCSSGESMGCLQKPLGFKCDCPTCDLGRKEKEQKKNEAWHIRVSEKVAAEENFPNDDIIKLFFSNSRGNLSDEGLRISWKSPNTEMLVEYLVYHQHWEPSYIRQKLLPMLSTLFLREMASNSTNKSLNGQYDFDSIRRVKMRYGHHVYVVNWKRTAMAMGNYAYTIPSGEHETTSNEVKCVDSLDELDAMEVQIDNGSLILSTEENMELVGAAFPEKVQQFLKEKELKELKPGKKTRSPKSIGAPDNSESPASRSIQLCITEFYRSAKAVCRETPPQNVGKSSEKGGGGGSSEGERSHSSSRNLSKPVRRRLLFG